MSLSLTGLVKSRTTLYVAGALIAGVVGGKMLWVDSTPAFKVPIASAKPAVTKAATKPSAARAATAQEDASAARSAQVSNVPPSGPAARQVYVAPPAPKRAAPADIDSSSDTEGLFLIASLKDVQGEQAAPSQAALTSIGDVANNALAERVVSSNTKVGSVTDGLGPVFVDDTNGYYMRFPAGWSIRRFDGEPWVVECGDGRSALMSIGFSAFPSEYTADNIPLDWVARRIKKRSDTTLNAQGYATIMGRKAIWSKSTGPMQVGTKQVKVVRTTYVLPLGDGRVAEIRIAAAPEVFEKMAPVMKNSVSTFRLVARKSGGGSEIMAKTE